ncbi:hypothetical protein P152DRAFT_54836 [Eremomyces bilateralis CBS 781.70]|uniref:Uncharacterized protein n=1 Tax=Eremomyces bilateralis CBS 781.70 TaxID=1392243 RepID=A0A6G1G0A9_9PEZI|nr:uncharacterized protein P152DRAFT_54836 [Eremomyces bilateralis CBS 781.70]KAF1811412.1 hypothetical protein P152DRAFT_54836 [Eremomyces bilateralis CBS 781.70]
MPPVNRPYTVPKPPPIGIWSVSSDVEWIKTNGMSHDFLRTSWSTAAVLQRRCGIEGLAMRSRGSCDALSAVSDSRMMTMGAWRLACNMTIALHFPSVFPHARSSTYFLIINGGRLLITITGNDGRVPGRCHPSRDGIGRLRYTMGGSLISHHIQQKRGGYPYDPSASGGSITSTK